MPIRYRAWVEPLLVAVVLTTLNALKPVVVDDVDKLYFAHQVASDPLHLYGFNVLWAQDVQPAWRLGLPPVMLYYVGLGYSLFGESVVLLKLWFLPIHWLLTGGLWWLFRRFARGLESPLLWLTAISPAILPSLNIMHEGTMLGFGLSGLAVFIRACDQRKLGLAALAGLLLDLCVQTKYTGLSMIGPFVIYAILRRRPLELLVASCVAATAFAAVEVFIAVQHGIGSLLWLQLSHHNPTRTKTASLVSRVMALAFQVGGMAFGPVLVGMIALKASRRVVIAAATIYALGYVVIAALPSPLGSSALISPVTGKPWNPRPDTLVFVTLALFLGVTTLGLVFGLARGAIRSLWTRRFGRSAQIRTFLVGWLASETVASLILSPFPAVRRFLGVFIVLAMIAGYVAARTARTTAKRGLIRQVAWGAIILGLLYQAVDIGEGIAGKDAAVEALRWVREREPQKPVWFCGEHGFEYYAQWTGMKPLLRDGSSKPEPGDWLVVDDPRGAAGKWATWFVVDPEELELVEKQPHGDPIPFTTQGCYYVGYRPLEHWNGPRIVARIYRVKKAFTPVKWPAGGPEPKPE